ncbi:MAG: sortase [Candidatus Dojkabacteria bacterium]
MWIKTIWLRKITLIALAAAIGHSLVTFFFLYYSSLPREMGSDLFSSAKQRNLPNAKEGQLNSLRIPKLEQELEVHVHEQEDKSGVWIREHARDPSSNNFVLSGHRFSWDWNPFGVLQRSPLFRIDQLEKGDRLELRLNGRDHHYKIAQKFEVAEHETWIENTSHEPELTLYTCKLQGAAAGRVVIKADLVK